MIHGRENILVEDWMRVSRLCDQSQGWLSFQVQKQTLESCVVTLNCKGRRLRYGVVEDIEQHRVSINLLPGYPAEAPWLIWHTPIFHPNINGQNVCLLGKWGAKTRLDEVCIWLWDMARYQLYNLEDPFNPAAARWARQHLSEFPTDDRDLRAKTTLDTAPDGASGPTTAENPDDLVARIRLL